MSSRKSHNTVVPAQLYGLTHHITTKQSYRTVRFHTDYNPSNFSWTQVLVVIINDLE